MTHSPVENTPSDLVGKTALVTGGGRAIGKEIALELAERGANVVLAARSEEAMSEVAELIRKAGRRALVVVMDLANEHSIKVGVQRAIAEFGHLDVLVNNSGVGGPTKSLVDLTAKEWEETFSVNVTGSVLLTREVLPSMLGRGSGSVIFVGSVTGKRPLVNRTPYAASKMAVVGLARSLAAEVGPSGVRVNVVSPGAVAGERFDWVLKTQAESRGISVEEVREEFTSSSPLRRMVEPRDVAAAVAFLASDRSMSITGEDMNVNAGIGMF